MLLAVAAVLGIAIDMGGTTDTANAAATITSRSATTRQPVTTASRTGTIPASPADPAGLVPTALVNRLFLSNIGPDGSPTAPVGIVVGALPAEFPGDLPVPPGTTVAGGTTSSPSRSAGALLDAPGTVQDVADFFLSSLRAKGWVLKSNGSNFTPGGFAPQAALPTTAFWCKATTGLVSILRAKIPSGTEIRLLLIAASTNHGLSPCNTTISTVPPPGPFSLPSLSAPSGATTLESANSASGRSTFATATVRSDLDTAALLDHYDRQLQGAGWTRVARTKSPGASVSTWKTKPIASGATPQDGVLVIASSGPTERQLVLRATVDASGAISPPAIIIPLPVPVPTTAATPPTIGASASTTTA